MAEEKVGFGFQFGVKGDKEVKRSLEDIIRLMGSAGNAASAISGILGKGFGLLEFGAAAAPIALAASALGVFAYKANEAGENLRRTRFEIDRLSKMPVGALTDSDLSANQSAILDQFRNLGLEAGNTFQLSFFDRIKNFGRGAYAVNWDVQASIANLFGAHMQSYEQGSPEAQDAMNRLMMDQKIATDRIKMAERTQQSLAAIHRRAAQEIAQLYSLDYLARTGQPGTGVMPESFMGQLRQREIRRNVDTSTDSTLQRQIDFDKQQLSTLRNAPVPNIPGTSADDHLQDMAKRAGDIKDLEGKINDELAKQLDARQDILELNRQERELARNFVSSQNYGSWRAVGGGGRAFIPPDFFRNFSSGKVGGIPTDVGYDTSKHPTAAQIIAREKNGLGGGASATTSSVADLGAVAKNAAVSIGNFAVEFVGRLLGVDNALDKFESGVGVVYNWVGSTNKTLFDKNTGIISHDMLTSPPTLKKREDEINSSPFDFKGLLHDLFSSPPQLKGHDPLSSNRYRLDPATLSRNLTADYFKKDGTISDVDRSVYRDTGGHVTKALAATKANAAQASWAHAMRYGSMSGHIDPSFHPGSMNHNILGEMNSRVKGWQAPAWAHGASGSLQSLDVLKSIDKNIGKVGIPTLVN